MRYDNATEFKFDFQGHEFTAYFDQSNNLIDIDCDDYEFERDLDYDNARYKAQEDYELFLKNEEADAKDWENTKWHLNKQFVKAEMAEINYICL